MPTPISRRSALQALTTATAVVAGAPAILRGRFQLFADSPTEYSARTIRLIQESPVVDLLCQFAFPDFRQEGLPLPTRWLREPGAFTEAHWAAYRDSGVNVLALGRGASNYEGMLIFLAEWNGFIAAYSNWFMRVDRPGHLDEVVNSGKVGIMMTTQNADHFRSLDDVNTFFALGQRIAQLTYNFQNRIGAGFLEHNDGGLSVFGHQMVERMEEVGMAVDLSHCADRTTLDALAAAKRPALFTHAACRALMPGYTRNKTDEMIQKLAATGGVMGMACIRFMIRPEPPVTVEHVVDHFDHVIRLVGAEHVAIGSDLDINGLGSPIPATGTSPAIANQPNFDRYGAYYAENGGVHVDGLGHNRRMFDLTEAFVRRGYSDGTIRLILGGNAVRVFKQLWG
ncbi:MAG: dipeptidase [Gemmatimonadales bacterium]